MIHEELLLPRFLMKPFLNLQIFYQLLTWHEGRYARMYLYIDFQKLKKVTLQNNIQNCMNAISWIF